MRIQVVSSIINNVPVEIGGEYNHTCIGMNPSLMEEANLKPCQKVCITSEQYDFTGYVIPKDIKGCILEGFFANYVSTRTVSIVAYCEIDEETEYTPIIINL